MRVREDSIKIGNTEIDYVSFGRGIIKGNFISNSLNY